MEDQGKDKAGAPHTIRKAMLVTTGLAFITGGTLAWQMGGSSSASPGQSTLFTPLPEEHADLQNTPPRSLSEPHKSEYAGASGGTAAKGQASNKSSAQLVINGQAIPLPPDGHVRQTVRNGSGETHIDVRMSSSSQSTTGDAAQ